MAHGGAVQAGGSVRERTTAERRAGGLSRRALLAAGGAVAAAAATTGVVLWRGATDQSNTPVGTTTSTPTPTTQITAPPPTPGDLPLALESAVGAKPMADFSFEGHLPQGSWATKAKGQLSYDHDAVSSLDTRMDMTVTAEHIELTKRVILADAEYVDGKEVTDPAKGRIM
ncbi:hypothetical protein [Nonomuraea sp. NPDC046570]|uniref:hypothetical protein n=1 Tax=Nonomuraea sp. NPDC046570 TaxID=3155255 RepID=UPI0033E24549